MNIPTTTYTVRTRKTTYRTILDGGIHIHATKRQDDGTVLARCGIQGPATSSAHGCVTCGPCQDAPTSDQKEPEMTAPEDLPEPPDGAMAIISFTYAKDEPVLVFRDDSDPYGQGDNRWFNEEEHTNPWVSWVYLMRSASVVYVVPTAPTAKREA